MVNDSPRSGGCARTLLTNLLSRITLGRYASGQSRLTVNQFLRVRGFDSLSAHYLEIRRCSSPPALLIYAAVVQRQDAALIRRKLWFDPTRRHRIPPRGFSPRGDVAGV